MRKLVLLHIVLLCLFATAQSQNSQPAKVAVGSTSKAVAAPVRLDDELKGFQARIARVGDDVYVSGQPSEQALRDLKARGVSTIVNLRTPEEMARIGFDEKAVAESLGMKYVYLPVRGNAEFPYSPDTLTKFAAALKEAKGGVLLHCTIAWRASHLWTAYLIQERGLSQEEAIKHGRAINLMDDHRGGEGRLPVEDFLNKDLTGLHRVKNQ